MRVVFAPAALAALAFAILLSLAVGARAIPLGEVFDALFGHLDGGNAAVVNDVRLPRTVARAPGRRRARPGRAR